MIEDNEVNTEEETLEPTAETPETQPEAEPAAPEEVEETPAKEFPEGNRVRKLSTY